MYNRESKKINWNAISAVASSGAVIIAIITIIISSNYNIRLINQQIKEEYLEFRPFISLLSAPEIANNYVKIYYTNIGKTVAEDLKISLLNNNNERFKFKKNNEEWRLVGDVIPNSTMRTDFEISDYKILKYIEIKYSSYNKDCISLIIPVIYDERTNSFSHDNIQEKNCIKEYEKIRN